MRIKSDEEIKKMGYFVNHYIIKKGDFSITKEFIEFAQKTGFKPLYTEMFNGIKCYRGTTRFPYGDIEAWVPVEMFNTITRGDF